MSYCEREVKPPILTTTLSRNANSALWSRQSEYRLSAVTIVKYIISPLPVEVYRNSYTATTLRADRWGALATTPLAFWQAMFEKGHSV